MSWRVIAAVMISLFAILAVSAMTANPLHEVTDSIEQIGDDNQDVEDQADMGERAYNNLILILVFGIILWSAWRVLRRELTEGRL